MKRTFKYEDRCFH